MLQSLLQPRPLHGHPVRHERRRKDKRRRPSQLALQLGRSGNSPSPTPSPPGYYDSDFYFCGKVSTLHAVVGSILLGIVVTVVGVVQLSPGAEAAQHRYYLMGSGAALIGAGIVGAFLRCFCIHWHNRKMHPVPPEAHEHPPPAATTAQAAKNGIDGASEKHHAKQVVHKPPLKTQASVTSPRQEHDTIIKPGAVRNT